VSRVALARGSAVTRTPVWAAIGAAARLLQILIKCRLFEICEKTRLIRLEYGQKARGAENECFKPCW